MTEQQLQSVMSQNIAQAAASRCKAVTARWLAGWALAGVQKVRIPRFPNTEPKFLNNYKEMRLLQ